MPRDQRVLKWCIRLMLPVFALGGFGGIWGLVLAGMNSQTIRSEAWSPDGRYRATIVTSGAWDGCGRFNSSLVLVERRIYRVKTGEFAPFCLDGPPERISISWHDARTLAVGCSGCDQNSAYADENWGALHFRYDLDIP